MDGLGGTITVIVVIILSVGLMVVFPLMTTADRVDDVTQQVLDTEVADLVNDFCTTRSITQEKLDKFTEAINSTGYAYVSEIRVEVLDENEGKKLAQAIQEKTGENSTYVIYDTGVRETVEKNGEMKLSPGYRVYVSVINPNPTIYQQITGSDTYRQISSDSGVVY